MESNRTNIAREKSPTVILTNKTYGFTKDLNIGDKGQLEVTLEIVSQTMEPDANGNSTIRHTLHVVTASPLNQKLVRQ